MNSACLLYCVYVLALPENEQHLGLHYRHVGQPILILRDVIGHVTI